MSDSQQAGDDYVTKPFSMEEVLLRLHRLVQRSGVAAMDTAELVVGDLTLNVDTREVTRGGQDIPLTATQFELLRYLMENPPKRVVSKAQILDRVWDYDFGGQANIVELYISYLRKKIEAGHPPDDPYHPGVPATSSSLRTSPWAPSREWPGSPECRPDRLSSVGSIPPPGTCVHAWSWWPWHY